MRIFPVVLFQFIFYFYLLFLFFVVVVVSIFTFPSLKLHAIARFLAGSFAVHPGDQLRSNLGIICGLRIICGAVHFQCSYLGDVNFWKVFFPTFST